MQKNKHTFDLLSNSIHIMSVNKLEHIQFIKLEQIL